MKKTAAKSGIQLKQFIAEAFGISNNKAKDIIDGRNVYVNNRRVWMASHVLNKGDVVEAREGAEVKSKAGIAVLYEDREHIVINKPAGVASNEGRGSAEDMLRKERKDNNILAAHRLDKNTSGAMLFVKGRAVLERYKKIWKEKQVKKTYLAVCEGEARFENRAVDTAVDGREALSHFCRVSSRAGLTLFRINIETGRKHQIRIHAASIGYPVAGDSEYGRVEVKNASARSAPRQMLHAYKLTFPASGKMVTITCPLPQDFMDLAKAAGYEG